ncbi:MAG: elongation factor P [Myxococcales bacterium]|nr:elongation factor P [Myxococcales bacterium]
MYTTAEFRKGLKIEIDGEPFEIVEFQHVKPGKGNAFVRTRLKNLSTGNVLERTFKSGDKVETPNLEEREMQYLYREGDNFYFMDNSNFEQLFIEKDKLQGGEKWLQENVKVGVLFYNGQPLTVALPNFVELAVVSTDPGIKGDTAAGGTKPATLETGAIIQVPLFLKEGERIRIDTRTGAYVERVK